MGNLKKNWPIITLVVGILIGMAAPLVLGLGAPEAVLADEHVRRAYLGEADEVLSEPPEALEPAAP